MGWHTESKNILGGEMVQRIRVNRIIMRTRAENGICNLFSIAF